MIPSIISTQYLAGYSAALSVLSGAGCYGWSTPIMNYFLNPKSDRYMTSAQAAFMVAIIDFGEMIICIPAGIIADKYGRKPCILITGPIYASSWLAIIISKSYLVLCIMRIIQGIAMALTFAVVPMYLGEISTVSHRGSITGAFSFAWFFGYFIEYCVGPFVSFVTFTIFTACIPVIFTIIFFWQPESPYYFLMKENIPEAMAALKWLRKGCDEDTIMNELEEMKDTVRKDLANKPRWKDIVDTPADKRALLIIFLIGGIRVLSGAIALQTYATNLFSEFGVILLSPDILTIVMGSALVFGGMINSVAVDSLGRRPLLFISCIGSSISLFAVGTYIFIRNNSSTDISTYSWVVPLGVIIYCLFSVVGMHPISMTYTSELFTTKTRGKASSLSTINLTIWSFICIEIYQLIGDNFGLVVVFYFFTAVCLLGALVLYFLAPETKGKSFDQIRREILNVRKHV